MTVIPFTRPEPIETTWAGKAKCISCKHEWVAVAPLDVEWIECPACGLAHGHAKYTFGGQVGDSVLQCNCGSEALTALYRKDKFWLLCMACGTDQTAAVFGDSA